MTYESSDCINALNEVNSEIEGNLSVSKYREVCKPHHPCANTIKNHFDGWNEAKSKAGLNTVQHTKGVNVEYFDTIDSETAYWLGFILADGHVSDSFRLGISKRDQEHLESFKEAIDSDHTIYEQYDDRNGSEMVGLSIWQEDFVSKIKDLVGVDKTFSETVPEVPVEHARHLIRGIYDGDGCHHHQHRCIRITGHGPRLRIIESMCPTSGSLCTNKGEDNPTDHAELRFWSESAELMADWMYPNEEDTEPKLDRKYPNWL